MSAVAAAPVSEHPPVASARRGRRLLAPLPGLVGLIAIAALLPLRGTWVVDLALVALTLTVPGVLALRALGVPSAAVTGYPIYIPAAALLVLMAAGTGVDLIGPSVGIARPLHGDTTALATLGLALVLWLLGIRRPAAARFPWRSILDRPLLLAPLALPLLAGYGALMLTNGHGTLAARIAACITAAALLFCLLRADRLSRAQVGMLLFGCALAAEWAFSLRSQEIIGFDIATELHVAQQTQALGIWHPVHHNDAYGAMLSLTVLPSTLASLTGLTPLIAFKVLFPVLGALIPVSVFLVAERVMRRGFAASAAALLIVQSYFFQVLPEIARQEIGLVFFAALVSSLFDDRLGRGPRLRLITTLGIGLVVSHYSSTYLAIPIVLIALVLQLIISRVRWITAALPLHLLCAAVVLIGGAAIWDGAVTHSASNLTSLSSSLQSRGLDLLPTRTGGVVSNYLSGNVVSDLDGPSFEQLAVNDYRGRAAYIHPFAAARQKRFQLQSASVPTPRVRIPALASGVRALWILVGELMLLFGSVGAVLMIAWRRNDALVREIGILAVATLALLAVIRVSGTAALAYNQTRALLQSLILLAIPAAWLAKEIVARLLWYRWARRLSRATAAVMAVALALVFAYQSGVTPLISGGGTSLNLSQRGEDFERQYMTRAEISAAAWVTSHSANQLLYADRYGQLRLFLSSGRVALTALTPRTLDRDSWVYGTRTNVVLGRARGQIADFSALYKWPAAFLDTYFNTVYANNDSRVYHR